MICGGLLGVVGELVVGWDDGTIMDGSGRGDM